MNYRNISGPKAFLASAIVTTAIVGITFLFAIPLINSKPPSIDHESSTTENSQHRLNQRQYANHQYEQCLNRVDLENSTVPSKTRYSDKATEQILNSTSESREREGRERCLRSYQRALDSL